MAKRKRKLTTPETVDEKEEVQKNLYQDLSSKIRLSESYVSLILGGVVVLGLSVVIFLFIRESGYQKPPPIFEENVGSVTTPITQRTYILQEGESLWDVAVKFYGDGYRYTEIIDANKLENPDYVPPGTRLIIPNIR